MYFSISIKKILNFLSYLINYNTFKVGISLVFEINNPHDYFALAGKSIAYHLPRAGGRLVTISRFVTQHPPRVVRSN